MDKWKQLSEYCQNKDNCCMYCELNQNMFNRCPHIDNFDKKRFYEDKFAECEHYELSYDYILNLIRGES
jgi:hypothetical protein